ncbi:formate dehydrogenase accessory sulfurtransferase FdhD [bacterium SCSIO 12741]|nr:formate dehydrogenase accessory sulfurtransferase FdhD [bacterium SCSIO 12741]
MKTPVKQIELLTLDQGVQESKRDILATEEPMEIRVRFGPRTEREERNLSVTMRTPGNDFELALGFMYNEGIISSYDQVALIRYCETIKDEAEKGNVVIVELSDSVELDWSKLERHFYTTSSCGVCGKSSLEAVEVQCPAPLNASLRIQAETLIQLPETLREQQHLFEYTGGIHASALFSPSGELRMLREDVGRHNALDKITGAGLFESQLPLSDSVLLVSGRASFELVQKAIVSGIPVLAAVGAPSSLAVDLAEKQGLTLVGFLRGERFNIYTHPERIILPS